MPAKKFGLKFGKILLCLVLAAFAGLYSCEMRAYRNAERKNSIEAYEHFLEKYPKSEKRQAAQGHIAHLYFEKAFKQNTVEAYEDYLGRYPNSISGAKVVNGLSMLLEPELKNLTVEQMAKMSAEIKTGLGTVKVKFFPEKAPETCRNFIKLARTRFYDNTQFHLVIPGVLIQGGSPEGDPRGGPGYIIKAEFNDLPNVPGTVGMARQEHPDSAGSQFYICLRRLQERDGKYTVFGQVAEGLEVVEALSNLESSGPQGRPVPYQPVNPVVIQGIKIVQEKQ